MDITRPEATAGPIRRNFRPEKVSADMPPFFSSLGSSFSSSFFWSGFWLFLADWGADVACGFLSASLSLSCGVCAPAKREERISNATRRVIKRDFKETPVRAQTKAGQTSWDSLKPGRLRSWRSKICQNRYVYRNQAGVRSGSFEGLRLLRIY